MLTKFFGYVTSHE